MHIAIIAENAAIALTFAQIAMLKPSGSGAFRATKLLAERKQPPVNVH